MKFTGFDKGEHLETRYHIKERSGLFQVYSEVVTTTHTYKNFVCECLTKASAEIMIQRLKEMDL